MRAAHTPMGLLECHIAKSIFVKSFNTAFVISLGRRQAENDSEFISENLPDTTLQTTTVGNPETENLHHPPPYPTETIKNTNPYEKSYRH